MTDPVAPSRIVRLPPTLVDQIAAGEVVERPASVVKELCENSLDAGARRIDIEITSGGRACIRIVDDGCGMTPEEVRLALERHATSKIRSADDLWGVQTFGFRGEALPSIASVSRLTVQSRTPEAAEGFLLQVEAGQQIQARAVGMPQGTQIEVRDLFFNTPARLKFQKTEATETANVSEAVLRLAVANPDVHFRLRTNGRVAMDLPPHRDLPERVRAAMARRGGGVLHEAVGDENGICVQAFSAGPECASTTARNTFLFVGRRFVRDRSLLQAVCMGYGEALEKGRYPLALLFLDVPGEDLDVNVHPQKLEVRFAQPQPVYAAVRHILLAASARAPWGASQAARAHSHIIANPSGAALPSRSRGLQVPRQDVARPFNIDRVFTTDSTSSASSCADGAGGAVGYGPAKTADNASVDLTAPQSQGLSARNHALTSLRFVGVFPLAHFLLEAEDGGLLIVDVHAAHERVAFERLTTHFPTGLAQQRLLFPIPVEVDEDAMITLEARASDLERLGFDVASFGTKTILVRAVPELLAQTDPKPLLLDLIAALAAAPAGDLAGAQANKVLSLLACHSARRSPAVTNQESAEKLLRQLDEVDWRTSCPHDRPVLVSLGLGEIERRFGRT